MLTVLPRSRTGRPGPAWQYSYPTNIAFVLEDRLEKLSGPIRKSSTCDRCQYYSLDSHAKTKAPRYEDLCRHAPLLDLAQRGPMPYQSVTNPITGEPTYVLHDDVFGQLGLLRVLRVGLIRLAIPPRESFRPRNMSRAHEVRTDQRSTRYR